MGDTRSNSQSATSGPLNKAAVLPRPLALGSRSFWRQRTVRGHSTHTPSRCPYSGFLLDREDQAAAIILLNTED
jgi:hypothetical protein